MNRSLPSRSLTCMAGTQIFEPSPAASHGCALAGSWTEAEEPGHSNTGYDQQRSLNCYTKCSTLITSGFVKYTLQTVQKVPKYLHQWAAAQTGRSPESTGGLDTNSDNLRPQNASRTKRHTRTVDNDRACSHPVSLTVHDLGKPSTWHSLTPPCVAGIFNILCPPVAGEWAV